MRHRVVVITSVYHMLKFQLVGVGVLCPVSPMLMGGDEAMRMSFVVRDSKASDVTVVSQVIVKVLVVVDFDMPVDMLNH